MHYVALFVCRPYEVMTVKEWFRFRPLQSSKSSLAFLQQLPMSKAIVLIQILVKRSDFEYCQQDGRAYT